MTSRQLLPTRDDLMPTTAEDIRCTNDRAQFDLLLDDRAVIHANEQIARIEGDTPFRTRRRLLATSVRLSERMAPDVKRMADDCTERLGVDIPLELFVFPSPRFNAMCFRPEQGRLFVMFSSSLLESFSHSELKFVMGHELGHHIYRHHDIPIGYILRGSAKPDPRLALQLFGWSRYAEVSADRAGAYCAENPERVSRALFKLASGLTGKTIEFHLDDFLAQLDQMQVEDAEPGAGAPKEDWFSTHPFSPLRVKALMLFHTSKLVKPAGMTRENLELGVQSLMRLMQPNYLEGRTQSAESMRRLLFAASIVVASADGEIGEHEIEVFESFFGKGSFVDSLDPERLEATLDERMEQVRKLASPPQAMQVLRDLCLVARANGHTSEAERGVLDRVAAGLAVATHFVSQAIEAELSPD